MFYTNLLKKLDVSVSGFFSRQMTLVILLVLAVNHLDNINQHNAAAQHLQDQAGDLQEGTRRFNLPGMAIASYPHHYSYWPFQVST